ncbi:glycosyltransferase family 4 protein [Microbacterium halophytorum]|uniref:glycosyltransferase family 4 protein n=1 Tax=Microbacterium halophytorum TaxID=2067568 RepID=UPI001E41FDE5|nr:glycosyltransferase family 4 protein [Microbacterium halophytorum]
MMRVAYICADPGIPVLGTKGASIHVQQIVRALRRRGADVTVYCTRRGDGDEALLGGARVVEDRVPRADPGQRELLVAAAAARLAERADADGCDLVYERYALFSDAAARVGAPAVVEVNAPLIDEQRTHRSLVHAAESEAVTRDLLSRADVVACVSEPVAEWAGRFGAPHARVVPNGVDTRAFSPASHGDGPLRVAFVGSLKPWHGVEVAIEAVAGLDGTELVVVGDGPERSRLEELAAARGAPVTWLGAVPHGQVPGVLASAHAGVAPYPERAETYFSPLKVYEYMAAGLAIAASDAGQIPSIIDHGRTGLLVPPGDAVALRRTLAALRDDRMVASGLGAAARERAVRHHDWDRTLATILDALQAQEVPA